MSDLIFVLSDQNGDLVGHMSFQEKNYLQPWVCKLSVCKLRTKTPQQHLAAPFNNPQTLKFKTQLTIANKMDKKIEIHQSQLMDTTF